MAKSPRSATAASLLFALLFVMVESASSNPTFTIGSNHYQTVFAFPHDLLKWPDRGTILFYNPQTLPWQGDVTNINNRPSESYTSNYQDVEFAPPSDYQGNPEDIRSWMKVSSYAYRNRYLLGGLTATKYGKFLIELGRTTENMELSAEGVARASQTTEVSTSYDLVPFEGSTRASRDNLDLTLTFARTIRQLPIGLKLKYTKTSSDVPEGYINFTKNGTSYYTSHLTWGWATTGCNHIFGYRGINADAFFQNEYSVYNGHQLDLQLSFEINGNHKTGIRYRTNREDGENYYWRYEEGAEFDGAYYVDEYWKDRKSSKLLRGYTKAKIWELGDLDLGVLLFLQRDTHTKTEVNKLSENDPKREEREGQYIIETNPFANYNAKWGYFDFGMLMELSRTGMQNVGSRWNPVSQAEQPEVLWSTSPYVGWSSSWENFSKGSRWFFATGFEAYSSVNVYKRLAIQSRLLVLRKYTFLEKVYGNSEIPEGSNSFEFFQTHQRDDRKNETWMTGSIGFAYGMGPVQSFVSLELPIAYLIKQTTKLKDETGQLFEHSKQSMWQVQEPMTARIMLVYAFGSPGVGHPGPRIH